jgi:hypothetical protein
VPPPRPTEPAPPHRIPRVRRGVVADQRPASSVGRGQLRSAPPDPPQPPAVSNTPRGSSTPKTFRGCRRVWRRCRGLPPARRLLTWNGQGAAQAASRRLGPSTALACQPPPSLPLPSHVSPSALCDQRHPKNRPCGLFLPLWFSPPVSSAGGRGWRRAACRPRVSALWRTPCGRHGKEDYGTTRGAGQM